MAYTSVQNFKAIIKNNYLLIEFILERLKIQISPSKQTEIEGLKFLLGRLDYS